MISIAHGDPIEWQNSNSGDPSISLRRRDTFDNFLKDIDYVQKLIGADHVGIATDLFGLDDHTAIPTHKEFALIPAALLKRGYTDGGR